MFKKELILIDISILSILYSLTLTIVIMIYNFNIIFSFNFDVDRFLLIFLPGQNSYHLQKVISAPLLYLFVLFIIDYMLYKYIKISIEENINSKYLSIHLTISTILSIIFILPQLIEGFNIIFNI